MLFIYSFCNKYVFYLFICFKCYLDHFQKKKNKMLFRYYAFYFILVNIPTFCININPTCEIEKKIRKKIVKGIGFNSQFESSVFQAWTQKTFLRRRNNRMKKWEKREPKFSISYAGEGDTCGFCGQPKMHKKSSSRL